MTRAYEVEKGKGKISIGADRWKLPLAMGRSIELLEEQILAVKAILVSFGGAPVVVDCSHMTYRA